MYPASPRLPNLAGAVLHLSGSSRKEVKWYKEHSIFFIENILGKKLTFKQLNIFGFVIVWKSKCFDGFCGNIILNKKTKTQTTPLNSAHDFLRKKATASSVKTRKLHVPWEGSSDSSNSTIRLEAATATCWPPTRSVTNELYALFLF